MTKFEFLWLLAAGSAGYLFWGFRTLPREEWQIMAALPVRRSRGGVWQGMNLTWYGFFSANAYLAAVVLFLLLTGALGLQPAALGVFVAGLLGICVPASRWVARLVEGKAHTMTVGGAVFVGLLISPFVLLAGNRVAAELGLAPLPTLPVLAALGIAYAFGEGLGRLACLSFGCCYGKALAGSPPLLRLMLGRFSLRFFGATKKIAYAGGLEGERVLPVQALTALVCVVTGLVGSALYLEKNFATAFLVAVATTQMWRVFSEFLRADFRGSGRLTAYQWMALAGIPYAAGLVSTAGPAPMMDPAIGAGLAALWTPQALLCLQVLWLLIFFCTGRSSVTSATLEFQVCRERI